MSAITSTAASYTVLMSCAGAGALWRPQLFTLPFDLSALPRRRRDVADWVKQARIRRLGPSEELNQAREFGGALFNGLFRGELLAGLRASRAALAPGERLRVRLRLPADLALIPWELLYDAQEDQFLALAPNLALLRYPELPTPIAPLHVDGPLQVVVVLASPQGGDYPPIKLDRELHRIESVLSGPRDQGHIALDIIRGPGTLDQLRARLHRPVHVLHVLCHGDLDEAREGVRAWAEQRRRREQFYAAVRDPRARFGPPLQYIESGDFATALDLLEDLLSRQPANRAAVDLTAALIERADAPLPVRLRAARLAERVGDPRPGVRTLEPAWRVFPAGRYLVGGQGDPTSSAASHPQRLWLGDFQIARYPVTVQQFRRFWEDREGYASRRWWTAQGWAWKQEHAVTQPYRWGDRDWMALNQPVAGVSWYEAAAFCAWLTQRRREAAWLRRGQIIRLPSEAEWEVAATWDSRTRQPRPWRPPGGAIWQNVVEAGIGRAAPVGIFPEGASPSGVLDMAGNVWEWCGSRYADYPQAAAQVQADFAANDCGPAARGGAYNIQNALSGWNARTWYFPSLHQYNFMGFRVVLAFRRLWS